MPTISFIGLPGAGKSTIFHELRESLSASAQLADAVQAGRRTKVAAAWRYRRFLLTSLCLISKTNRTLAQKVYGLRLVLQSVNLSFVAQNSEGRRWVLLDESVPQRVFTLLVSEGCVRREQLDRALRRMPIEDLVIFVRTKMSTVRLRLRERDRGLPARFDPSNDHEGILEEAELLFFDIIQRQNRVSPGKGLTVSGDVLPSVAIGQILEHLLRYEGEH